MKKKLIITFSVIAIVAVAGYFGYRYAVNYVFDEYVLKTALTALNESEKAKNPEKSENGEDKIQVEAFLDGLKNPEKAEDKEKTEKKESKAEKTEKKEANKPAPKEQEKPSSDKAKTTSEKKTESTEKKETKPSTEKSSEETAKASGGEVKQTAGKKTEDKKESNPAAESAKPQETEQKSESPAEPPKSGATLSDSEVLSRVMSDPDLSYKLASMISYSDKQAAISMAMSNFSADEIAEMVASGMSKSEMISIARSRITGGQWSACMEIARKYVDQMRPYVE